MHKIRKFEINDQEQVEKLFLQLIGGGVDLNAKELINDNAVHCLVIEENEEVVGFASLIIYYLPTLGKMGEIEDVVVAEKCRGKGFWQRNNECTHRTRKRKKTQKIATHKQS